MSDELITSRLLLRRFAVDDLTAYQQVMGQDLVGRHLPRGRGLSMDESAALLDTWQRHVAEHGYGPWCVTNRSDGQVIGHCGVRYIDDTDEVELLYALQHQSWGRGLASEAAAAAVDDAEARMLCSHLVAYTTSANGASQAVLLRCGFEPAGQRYLWGLDLDRFIRPMPHHQAVSGHQRRGIDDA